MKKYLLAASAAAMAFAIAPAANAAEFIVSGGSGAVALNGNNNFTDELAVLGLDKEVEGAMVTISGAASGYKILFEYLGADAGFNNTFTYGGVGGPTVSEQGENYFDDPHSFGSYVDWGSAFLGIFSSLEGQPSVGPGQDGFTVFVKGATYESGAGFSSIIFAFDDHNPSDPSDDDNSDDLVIRATIVAVPEPATWALMLAGVAAVGVSMRRRSKNVRVAFS